MTDYPKAVKRQLRELARRAYERELAGELNLLAQRFDAWRDGKISTSDLCEAIDRFHDGPSRELYARYDTPMLDVAVGYALATGTLQEADVPAEVRPYLVNAVALYRSLQEGR